MVQQILDPSGTLQHVILSHDPMLSQQTHPPPPQQSHHGGVPITPYVSIFFNEAIAIEGHILYNCSLEKLSISTRYSSSSVHSGLFQPPLQSSFRSM